MDMTICQLERRLGESVHRVVSLRRGTRSEADLIFVGKNEKFRDDVERCLVDDLGVAQDAGDDSSDVRAGYMISTPVLVIL